MGAEEPGPAALLVRVVAQPDDGEGGQAGQHADGDEVLGEPDQRPVPDPGIENVRWNREP